MSRLTGRVKRLERADGSCPVCGWPDNGITLEIVEELLTGTAEEVHAAIEKEARQPHWLQPCEECGRTPIVAEVVPLVVDPDKGPVGGGIPQRR